MTHVIESHPVQVVVAYDLSPSSELALVRAIDVAARAPQHVLHIAFAIDSHDLYETAEAARTVVLEHVTRALAGREIQFFVHARIGKPAVEVLAVAGEVGADLIFIGSHGQTGVERFLIGSVSERVVREAKCPVMVAREKTYPDIDSMHAGDR